MIVDEGGGQVLLEQEGILVRIKVWGPRGGIPGPSAETSVIKALVRLYSAALLIKPSNAYE